MLSIEEIVVKLGLENSDPEVQNKILQDLANAVSSRILLRVTEKLSDTEIDELADIADTDDEDKMNAYLSTKIPNYEEFKSKIEEEFIEEISTQRLDVQDKISALRIERIKNETQV